MAAVVCVGAWKKKKQEKLKPTPLFLQKRRSSQVKETFWQSHRGTGERLVCHSSILKVAEERLFAAVRNFREMYDYLCTTRCHTKGPVLLSDDHQSSKTCASSLHPVSALDQTRRSCSTPSTKLPSDVLLFHGIWFEGDKRPTDYLELVVKT